MDLLTAELKNTGLNLANQNREGFDGIASTIGTAGADSRLVLDELVAKTAAAGLDIKNSLDTLSLKTETAGVNTNGALGLG